MKALTFVTKTEHEVEAKEKCKPDNAQYQVLCKINNLVAVSSPLPLRFLVKIDFRADGCWIWNGSTGFHPKYRHHRYGQFMVWTPGGATARERRKMTSAHRFSYECANGVTVSKGDDVDHLCNNKLCVNPEHLEAVSHRENITRMYERRKAVRP